MTDRRRLRPGHHRTTKIDVRLAPEDLAVLDAYCDAGASRPDVVEALIRRLDGPLTLPDGRVLDPKGA